MRGKNVQNRGKIKKVITEETGRNVENQKMPAVKTRKIVAKNREKRGKNNLSPKESLPVGQAAAVLGVSAPTVRRMVDAGELEGFYTPGNHLRVSRESIERFRAGQASDPEGESEILVDDPGPSSVLRNRRERIEELALEAEEMRARRQLEQLRREQQEEEIERRQVEDSRNRRAEQEAAELERRRLERQQEREREKRRAEKQLNDFRRKWIKFGEDVLSRWDYQWLSASQRRQVGQVIEDEVSERECSDEPRMSQMITQVIAATMEPWVRVRSHEKLCGELADSVASFQLPTCATADERAAARMAIKNALRQFGPEASYSDLKAAAEHAVSPIRATAARRELIERTVSSAVSELPFAGRTPDDEAIFRRKSHIALSKLPADAREFEARHALKGIIREASEIIQRRQEKRESERRRQDLIQSGMRAASNRLTVLMLQGEIETDDAVRLKQEIREELEGIGGDESSSEIHDLVNEKIEEEVG